MQPTELPTRPEDLSLDILNRIIARQRRDVALSDFTIIEAHEWGGGHASSAGRMVIAPTYTASSPDGLPRQIVIKVAKNVPEARGGQNVGGTGTGQFYANEVNIYTRLRPADFLESPLTLGGEYDPNTDTFVLLLEDLRDRDAVFATIKMLTSRERMHSLLRQLAALHARYWNSPELGSALLWLGSHASGAIHDLFNSETVAKFMDYQVGQEQFKAEMIEYMGVTTTTLFDQVRRVQAHQSRLAQTICHGDMHIGNTYMLPGDKAGLLDWQLASRGYCMHDISYIIATALSTAERRSQERELLDYYSEQLRACGVAEPPAKDELWLEYRRAMAWNFHIGWLMTPVVNYGRDITVMALLRLMTAYVDLETAKAIDSL